MVPICEGVVGLWPTVTSIRVLFGPEAALSGDRTRRLTGTLLAALREAPENRWRSTRHPKTKSDQGVPTGGYRRGRPALPGRVRRDGLRRPPKGPSVGGA